MNKILVSHRKLFAFCRSCFEKLGLSAADARIVGENLLFANLRGVDSHGVIRMKIYADRPRAGGFKAKARPKVISEQPSAALIDARQGFGQVAAMAAMKLAISKAKRTGAAVVN